MTDEPNDPATDDAAPAADDLAALTAERDKYLELAQHTRADFENFQRRMQREIQSERKYSPQSMLSDLLPVVDNLDRALQATKKSLGEETPPPLVATLLQGVELVRKQLLDAVGKHGVAPIHPAPPDAFDPNVHEALMQQSTAFHPPMTVLQTVQTGYRFHDRVLRPAHVIVAVALPSEEAAP
ncbi:MAG: nucleotide exchange factor GrpE [Planctomycetia bacterium]